MRRVLTRLLFSFLIAVTAVLIGAVAIAKLVSLMRGPHEAAADLESAIGGYWPLILLAILVLTVGLSAVGRGKVDA
jgi:predicted CDP-diglyceride synthetase/phosphatidate cytidylyltransferase